MWIDTGIIIALLVIVFFVVFIRVAIKLQKESVELRKKLKNELRKRRKYSKN